MSKFLCGCPRLCQVEVWFRISREKSQRGGTDRERMHHGSLQPQGIGPGIALAPGKIGDGHG